MMQNMKMATPEQARKSLRHNTVFFWILSIYLGLQLAAFIIGFLNMQQLLTLVVITGSILAVIVLIDAIVLHVQNHRMGLPTQGFWTIYISRFVSVIPTLFGGGRAFADQVAAVAVMLLIIAEVFTYFTWRTADTRLRPLSGNE